MLGEWTGGCGIRLGGVGTRILAAEMNSWSYLIVITELKPFFPPNLVSCYSAFGVVERESYCSNSR